MLAYPDVQILDVVGPLEVFARTSRWLRDERGVAGAYTVEIIGLAAGPIAASSGLLLHAERGLGQIARQPRHRRVDTLMVAGGIGSDRHARDPRIVRFLRSQSTQVRRLASVCTGAFLLAEAGLLSGRRATTHWSSCAALAARYPDVQVDPDRLYVKDGAVYTSAGVTAGMDLALALVEEDFGREVALAVARALVMFVKRPGGQAQFSAQLAEQLAAREPVRELQAYIVEHPRGDLSVGTLARRLGMSPRNFARVFTHEVGTTPARFVTSTRVETARRLLEDSHDDLETVCAASGLGTTESMRRAFLRIVGVPPSEYRERFNTQPRTAGAAAAAAAAAARRVA